MSLIYVGPDGARYPLTPDQFAALLAKLKGDPEVTGLDSIANGVGGACTYQKITFSWVYDGVAELKVAILHDGNWKAKLAGNEAIFEELNSKLIQPVSVA